VKTWVKASVGGALGTGLVVVGLVGCVSSWVVLKGGGVFPRNPAFTIVPREYTAEELARAGLRTDGVYMVDRWHPPELDEEVRKYWTRWSGSLGSGYYRFWANGRTMDRTVWLGVKPEDFTAEHADSFERAWLGYYQILPDGSMEVEYYTSRDVYQKKRIRIRNGEIWLRRGEYKGQPSYLVYRFRPVPGMKTQPDW